MADGRYLKNKNRHFCIVVESITLRLTLNPITSFKNLKKIFQQVKIDI